MTTTNRTLPGTYRGYQIEVDPEFNGTEPAVLIFHQGAMIDWAYGDAPKALEWAHDLIDEWHNAA